MKCHYEILNVPRTVDDDDIKKSYRKLALKYHPDKNPENIEECTRQFHLIQQAYEVLIDPQERAWYDKHREAILRGGLGKGGDYEDDSLDVYQYFNAACFSGYGDDENGFYAVYSKVFETISAEDLEYMDEKESETEIPKFGNSQSTYEEIVGPFYAYWESYCTAKSYVWVEKYDTREGPNRQIRRLMEQDNKKLRDKAKKERNEEVRALVAFMRKRDKRVQAYKKYLEERASEIAKRAEEKKKKDREQRLKELENYEETAWSSMSGLENDLEKLESSYAQQFGEEHEVSINGEEENLEEEEEEYIDELFCVACNKEFKSDKAFANHEKSKKHKENIAFLRSQMLLEEETIGGGSGEVENAAEGVQSADVIVDDLDKIEDRFSDDMENVPKTKLSKKQKKKRKQQQKLLNDTSENTNETKTDATIPPGDVEQSCLIDVADPAGVANADVELSKDNPTDSTLTVDVSSIETESCTEENSRDKAEHPLNATNSAPESCNRCHKTFKTRNKLFTHLKETGHALRVEHIPDETTTTGKNKKKKKSNR